MLIKVEYYINNCENIRHEYNAFYVERFAVGESELIVLILTTY